MPVTIGIQPPVGTGSGFFEISPPESEALASSRVVFLSATLGAASFVVAMLPACFFGPPLGELLSLGCLMGDGIVRRS
jgi:hypothetical protein